MFTTQKETPSNNVKTFEETKDALHQTAHQAGHEMKEMYNSATKDVAQAGAYIAKEIRVNPVRSSAIALGVGVVLGMIFRR